MAILYKFKFSKIFSKKYPSAYRWNSNVLTIVFLIFVLPLFSEGKYTWSKAEVYVGEEVYLTLDTEANISEILAPEIGYISNSNDLPFMEVLNQTKDGSRLVFQIRFTKAGPQEFRVAWKEEGVLHEESISIKVESVLGANETEQQDIIEPLEFSGPYLFRLFVILIIFSAIVGVLYYIFLTRKHRKKEPKDAGISFAVEAEKMTPPDFEIENLLKNREILHKEFAYVLSDYLKSLLSQKLESDVTYMTQSELEELLRTRLRLTEKAVGEFSLYLNSIKYMPNDEKISVENAMGIRKYWERMLGI